MRGDIVASFQWFRSWHGAPMDHKWPVIAAKSGVKVGVVSAIAWALMDYASQHAERGTVDGFDVEAYAVYSGFSEDEVTAVIKAMNDKAVIVNGKLSNWEKRQPKREDDSRERVSHFRDMKRNVTQSNTSNAPEEIRVDTDKELKDVVVVRPNIFKIYEQEIGALTGMIGELLKDAETIYPEDWIIEALQESARQNKRSWSYAEAILKRRKAEGTATIKSNGNGRKPTKPVDTSLDELIRSGK